MRKYISEIQDNNFVYPNNDPYQYGVEIVHDINNNSVSGTVTNFVAVKSGNNVSVTFDYTWSKNGAEPFISQSDRLSILSVHMMTPETTYYKPWRMIDYVYDTDTSITGKTGSVSITVTPGQMGQASFGNGLYYFEIRMIGHRAIFPICVQGSIIVPSPTPTPTVSPGTPIASPTPTPTLTQTPSGTPTGTVLIYYRLTDCQSFINYYSQSWPIGTFNSGDRVMGSVGYYYVVSGTYTSPPAGVEQRYISATGLFGCP